MTDTPRPTEPHDPAVSHEPSDANVRGVLAFAAALAVLIAVVSLAVWGMFVFLKGREDREKRSRFPLAAAERRELDQPELGAPIAGELPRSPRLEGLSLNRSAQERAEEEEKRLNGSGTDENGRAHISIEAAMRLVAEESKPKGREPAPVRYDAGIPGTGGGSNSGRDLPEAKR
jgi:hypothetical protein